MNNYSLLKMYLSLNINMFSYEFEGYLKNNSYIEEILSRNENGIAFWNKNGRLLATPYTYGEKLDEMKQPLYLLCNTYDTNINTDKIYKVPIDKAVILKSRNDNTVDFDIINFYTRELTNLYQSIHLNVNQVKHPYIIHGTNSDTATINEFMKQIENCATAITADERFSPKTIDLKCPFYGEELSILYNKIESQMLGMIGIESNKTIKTERVTNQESDNDNTQASIIYASKLKNRKDAIKEIKDKLGFKVKLVENKKKDNLLQKMIGGVKNAENGKSN